MKLRKRALYEDWSSTMAPVCIKYVVSFSSQDGVHKVSNLLDLNGEKKWLSDPKDRSGILEAIFQLEHLCHLNFIDIGLIWCATLEVRVGRSDWPQGHEYISLAPTQMLMSPADCHLGRAATRTCMLTKAHCHQEVVEGEWDRVQVVCRQPWRKDVQLGLYFLRLRSDDIQILPDGMMVGGKSPRVHPAGRQQSVESIKQHFFGRKQDNEDDKDDVLKSQLQKLVAQSCWGGGESLPRIAHMVLTANQHCSRPALSDAPESSRGLYSSHVEQQSKPQINQEMKDFLAKLGKEEIDLDTVKISDLRHKFEKQKWRKLTSEEKQIFFACCQNFFADMYEDSVNGRAEDSSSSKSASAGFRTVLVEEASVKQGTTPGKTSALNRQLPGDPLEKNSPGLSSSEKFIKPECMAGIHQAFKPLQSTSGLNPSMAVKKGEMTSKRTSISERESPIDQVGPKKRLTLSPSTVKSTPPDGYCGILEAERTDLKDDVLDLVSQCVVARDSKDVQVSDIWLNSRIGQGIASSNTQAFSTPRSSGRSRGRGSRGRGRGRQVASLPEPDSKMQAAPIPVDSVRASRGRGQGRQVASAPRLETKTQVTPIPADCRHTPRGCKTRTHVDLLGKDSDDSIESMGCDLFEECPLCEEMFPRDQLGVHLVHCCS